MSVGVVASYEYLFERIGDTKEFENDLLRGKSPAAPALQPRLANATRCDEFRCSQGVLVPRTSRRPATVWALVGDAFGFLDPLYSSGVLLGFDQRFDGGRRRDRRDRAKATRPNVNLPANGSPRLPPAWTACGGWWCEFYDGFSFGRFVKK